MTAHDLDLAEFRETAYKIAFRILRDASQADDAAQRALVQALRRIESVRDQERINGWLAQVARTAALMHRRAEQRHTRHASPVPADEMGDDPVDHGQLEADASTRLMVHETLSRLAPRDRQALVQRHLEGASYAEIGRLQGTTANAAKAHTSRARARFRELF